MIDWRKWFDERKYAWDSMEERRYQSYKARLIEELEIQAPDTPEQRAEWADKMVLTPAAPKT